MKIAKEALGRATQALLANSLLTEESCRKLARLAIEAAVMPAYANYSHYNGDEFALVPVEPSRARRRRP